MITNTDELKENIERDGGAIFALDKSKGISSQRAVQKVKYWARDLTDNKKIKVGHGGTLDPLATGVLIIAIGRAFTKQIDTYVAAEKEYVASIKFGETSTTDDAEGEKAIVHVETIPVRDAVESVTEEFIGDIKQIPPAYSAIKINGQEAYKRMRRGEEVVMKPRRVHIEVIDILSYDYPVLKIRIVCGKGTYIRSLVRDIGKRLGTGAYMSDLVRTRVGVFTAQKCFPLTAFERTIK